MWVIVRYSTETARKKQREIDTDHGRGFVNSVLKDLEKELAHNALRELWESHCENSEIPDYQKTNSYGRDFERFYNAGREHMHLLLEVGDKDKNYRPFVKEVFKEMFKYAEAEVPTDLILEPVHNLLRSKAVKARTTICRLVLSFRSQFFGSVK